ncbi:MAG: ketoacyl-ACP synthase III [Clostridiaceae bacterium]|nr:ketoacyl-ACP synthase III [Clostridiaceae bacterium]
MLKLKLLGTGTYLPELILTNEMLSQIVETNDEWITSRTGITERRLSSGEPTWHMAVRAAEKALAASGLAANDLDLIVATSVTPDYFFPSVSSIVQDEIGAANAFCFDLNAACTGFVYAVDLAARYLNTGDIRNVLVVSAENVSKLTDYTDRATCVLFGDGASAAVFSAGSPDDESCLLASHLGTKGEGGKYLVSQALKINHPFIENDQVWPDRFGHDKGHNLTMEGNEVYKFAVNAMTESIKAATEKAGIKLAQIKYIIPHQANSRIVDASARRLKVKSAQMISRVSDFGNTSSASIPICLDEIIRDDRLKRGDLIAICGFGAGLTYGAAILRY